MQQVKACAYTAPANSLSPLSLHTLIPSDELGISSLGGDSRHSQTRVSTSPSADVYPASPSLARIQRKERKKDKKKEHVDSIMQTRYFPSDNLPPPSQMHYGLAAVGFAFSCFFFYQSAAAAAASVLFSSLSLSEEDKKNVSAKY